MPMVATTRFAFFLYSDVNTVFKRGKAQGINDFIETKKCKYFQRKLLFSVVMSTQCLGKFFPKFQFLTREKLNPNTYLVKRRNVERPRLEQANVARGERG